ncbi:NAD(P)-binding domain-containing protein [Arthrobacter sp. PGP41]|uniref:NAD(P)-binding domain-containing protein n=1 Tax=Arthrobacter sp. PGP41 TaxID=2079227 RepID=UPI00131A06DC|nr:NAD(P)-binding domain-containing protein [Arthrobacter sp. PGP41]
MTIIGLIGIGNIGSGVARWAIAAGYQTVLSNSRGPESLAGGRRDRDGGCSC